MSSHNNNNNTDFIEDLPPGPLDEYRRQTTFDWKKMKLFFEDPDLLKIKVICQKKKERIFNKNLKFLDAALETSRSRSGVSKAER